jgi:peptidoglycan-N-acetylglucosamine deacetylase
VIRHALAPHVSAFARELGIARTLGELPPAAAPLLASVPAAVAITFDDGPHPEGTPAILEVLAAHGASATFFLVGEQVLRRPQLAQRIAEAGHSIGLHGYRHRPHPACGSGAMRDDFERGTVAIAEATGTAPRLHRPPYGVYSHVSLQIARARGLQPLLWSKWGKDWRKFTTPERIARRALGGIAAGDVILLHDADFYSAKRSHSRTVAALPGLLATLQSAELDTVPVTYGDPMQEADGKPHVKVQGGGTPFAGVAPWSGPESKQTRRTS